MTHDEDEKPRSRAKWADLERRSVTLTARPSDGCPRPDFSTKGAETASSFADAPSVQESAGKLRSEAANGSSKGKGKGKKGKGKKGKGKGAETPEAPGEVKGNSEAAKLVRECLKEPFDEGTVLHHLSSVCEKIATDPEKELQPWFSFLPTLSEKLGEKAAAALEKAKKSDSAAGSAAGGGIAAQQYEAMQHASFISAMTVLKDVLPAYRIRTGEAGAAGGVGGGAAGSLSKSVYGTQKHEKALLEFWEKMVGIGVFGCMFYCWCDHCRTSLGVRPAGIVHTLVGRVLGSFQQIS